MGVPIVVLVENSVGGDGAVDLVIPVVAGINGKTAGRDLRAIGRLPNPLSLAS